MQQKSLTDHKSRQNFGEVNKQRKPYMLNDLNSITQLRSIEEGTPSVEKKSFDVAPFCLNIEDEIEQELLGVAATNTATDTKCFDELMREMDHSQRIYAKENKQSKTVTKEIPQESQLISDDLKILE